jgi:hypothetical protein
MTDINEWFKDQQDFLTKIGQVEKPAIKPATTKKDEE